MTCGHSVIHLAWAHTAQHIVHIHLGDYLVLWASGLTYQMHLSHFCHLWKPKMSPDIINIQVLGEGGICSPPAITTLKRLIASYNFFTFPMVDNFPIFLLFIWLSNFQSSTSLWCSGLSSPTLSSFTSGTVWQMHFKSQSSNDNKSSLYCKSKQLRRTEKCVF